MEQDFDKNLDGYFAEDLRKAGLDSRPIPREWLQLSAQLDAHALKKRERQQKWWLLLLGLLLLSNLWTGFQLHHLQAVVQNLGMQQTVAEKPLPSRERIVIMDTVYQTLVIQRREYVAPGPTDSWTHKAASARQKDMAPVSSQNNENQLFAQHEMAASNPPEEVKKEALSALPVNNEQQAAVEAPATAAAKPVYSDTLFETVPSQTSDKPTKATPNPVKNKLRYRVGAGAGGLHVLNSKESETPAAFLAQWHGEILLGKHWSVSSSLAMVIQNLELDHPADPRWMLQLPPSPDPDFSFQHLEGRLRYWLPALQVRYYFRPESQWSWYAGSGYAARIFDSAELDTEYYDPVNHQEIKIEAYQNTSARNLNLTGQLGMSWRIKQSGWQFFTDVNGVFDIGKGQQTFPLGFAQAGIKWGTH